MQALDQETPNTPPEPQAAPPNPDEVAGSSSEATLGAGAPAFEPLEDAEPAESEAAAEPATSGGLRVVPFSDEELLDGTMMFVMFGLGSAGLRLEALELERFRAEFSLLNRQPPIHTTVMFRALGLGEALARYGIGHGMVLDQVMGRVDALPAWLRILLAGLGVTAVSVKAARAVMREREREGSDVAVGASGRGSVAGMAA